MRPAPRCPSARGPHAGTLVQPDRAGRALRIDAQLGPEPAAPLELVECVRQERGAEPRPAVLAEDAEHRDPAAVRVAVVVRPADRDARGRPVHLGHEPQGRVAHAHAAQPVQPLLVRRGRMPPVVGERLLADPVQKRLVDTLDRRPDGRRDRPDG